MKVVNGNTIVTPKGSVEVQKETAHQSKDYTQSKQIGMRGFTIIPDGLYNNSISIIQVLIIAHLLRQCDIQHSNTIQVANSVLEKHVGVERTTIHRYSKELIEKGYFTKTIVISKKGTINQYQVNIEKIEEDFNFKMSDYYKSWNNK